MATSKNIKNLSVLPNIGKTLVEKLIKVGITNAQELKETGSEKTILKIAASKDSGACINMLYALEGAIQGIRWHHLSNERKLDLKEFYRSMSMK